jgi:hypothetical protein
MDENIKDKAISLLNIGIETGDWESNWCRIFN